MEIYTVTFLGHRTIHNMREVEERLDELMRKLLREKYYVDFLVGRNGTMSMLLLMKFFVVSSAVLSSLLVTMNVMTQIFVVLVAENMKLV